MKKKNLRPLILSSLAALAMAGIGTGATFALFTDKAETAINIEAGKVDVSTSISDLEFFELGSTAKITATDAEGALVNSIGGTVKVEDNALVLSKWAPGDKVTFKLTNKNLSNVAIKTRFVESNTHTGTDLYPALKVDYTAVNGENQDISHKFQDWQRVDPVADPATPETISVVSVTIEFPNADNEITSRDTGTNNAYQGADTRIVFAQEAVQGNAAVRSLLEEINAVLGASSQNNATMSAAFAELGAHDSTWNPNLFKRNHLVWGSTSDSVFYQEDVPDGQEYHYFKVYDEMPTAEPYSIYANGWTTAPTVSLAGLGFDAGTSSGITEISYIGGTGARENYILSNSFSTNITINAPLDVVHHYGNAGSVDIIAAANQSYHEHGKVAFMEVAKGRVVLENESKVEQIHVSTKVSAVDETTGEKTKVADVFDEIKIAYAGEVAELPVFSRDPVQIADGGTLVLELQKVEAEEVKSNEYVWLYQQGLKEQIRVTKEKTVTAEQLAAAPVSTDESKVEEKTATAAMQIANNLGGGKTYEQLVQEEKIAEDGSIKETEAATLALVEESGLSSDVLEETKVEAIEEAVSDEVVEKAEEGVEYVARIGEAGYESLSEAILAAKEGETVRLIKDITVNEYVNGVDYCRNKCYAKKIPHGVTLDGGNHKVTMTNQSARTVFISDLYGNLKNIVIDGLNGPVCGDVEMGAVFQGVTARGAFDVDGNVGAFAIYAWLDSSHPSNKLTFIDCVNEVNLNGTGTASDYNAAFIGYMVHSEYELTFTRCVNKGRIVCGSAGLFLGNVRSYSGKIYINDCRNEGLVQRTYIPENVYRVNQLLYGTVSDWSVTTIIDGETYTMAQVKSRQAELAIPGNPLVLGSTDSQLSLVKKNDDGTFTFHGTEGAAYYEMSVGLYVGTGGGSTRNYVKQKIDAVENKESYTTDIKDLRFVDKQWLDNHEGAETSNPDWNEQVTIVSYENNQYFLLNDDKWECNGEITPSELITISAFDAEGQLIASTGI